MAVPDDLKADLQRTVERFIAASDGSDLSAISSMYDPDFANVRVADQGGVTYLTREQMLYILQRGSIRVPTQSTSIHHVDILGGMGLVLLTRIKDTGSGWEPMFYSLVWRRRGEEWLLLREFVHQKSMPKH